MKLNSRILLVLLASSFIAAPPVGIGQGNEQATPPVTEIWIPEGTLIEAQLENALDANKAQVDDPLALEVKTEVRDGKARAVLIPRHARLLARVSSVSHPAGRKGQIELSLEVLRAEWQGGLAQLHGHIRRAELPGIAMLETASDPTTGEVAVQSMRLSRPIVLKKDGSLLFLSEHSLPAKTGLVIEHRLTLESCRDFALRGDAEAQFQMGLMYHQGKGVTQDYAQAADWYRKAAEQGVARAQNNLAVLCAQGQGVPTDYVAAYMWFNVAAPAKADKNQANLQLLERQMTPEQIAEGKRRAEEWMKLHPPSH